MDIHAYIISLVFDLVLDMIGIFILLWFVWKGVELFKSGVLWVMNYIYMRGE